MPERSVCALPATVVATLLLATAAASAARSVTCPLPGSELVKPGESYEGALVAVEMRTPTTGDQKGQAMLFCFREIGNVSGPGGRCRFVPGPGGRISATAETGVDIVRCTILGGSPQTNESACMIVCD